MLTQWARIWGDRLIQPAARWAHRLGLTPNRITVLGLALTALVALVLASGWLQLAGLLLIFTLGMDAVDGALARLSGTTSRFGAFLDSTLDRWAEVLLFGALIWHFLKLDQDTAVLLAVISMAASLLVSYTRARAEGVGLACKEGLLTRFERLAVLIIGLLTGQIVLALWLIAILASLTAVQRIWVTWRVDRAEH